MKPTLPKGTVVSYLGFEAVVIEDGPTEFLVSCEGNYEHWEWEVHGHTCEIVAYPESIDPKKNDWIPTNGKKPELPVDTLVDVKFLGGGVVTGYRADLWRWRQDGEPDDITHYRIHQLAEQKPTADKFVATFRCESNGIIGSTNAPIHSVSMHDDGVVEVVIDHWPEKPAPDVNALIEALEWYSEQVSGCRKITSEGEQCRASLDRDGGAIARAALATYRKQQGKSYDHD